MKNKKNIILKTFENADDTILNMTVSDLIKKYKDELETEKKNKSQHDLNVVNKYKNKYYKIIDDDILIVLHIEDMINDSHDIEYNTIYHIIGFRLTFANKHIFKETSFHCTQEELDQYAEISNDEYNEYIEVHTTINNLFTKVLNK